MCNAFTCRHTFTHVSVKANWCHAEATSKVQSREVMLDVLKTAVSGISIFGNPWATTSDKLQPTMALPG